jgi:hypothetical protein
MATWQQGNTSGNGTKSRARSLLAARAEVVFGRIEMRPVPLLILAPLALAACGQDPQPVVANPPPAQASTVLVPVPSISPTVPSGVTPGSGSSTPMVMRAHLTQSQVVTLLTNNTARGVDTNGRPYDAYLAAGGSFRMDRQGITQAGTWRVLPDGQICSALNNGGAAAEQCYYLTPESNYVRYDRSDGTPLGTFVVVSGNPQNL